MLPWDVPQLTALMIISGKAALLLTLAIGLRALLKKVSASTRYFLISATVILVAALPLLGLVAPDWKLPMPAILQSRLTREAAPPLLPNAIVDGSKIESPDGRVSASEAPTPPVSHQSGHILLHLWMLGTALTAGRVLLGLAGCARNRRRAVDLDSKHILALVNRAANRIGLRQRPAVMTSSRTGMPHVSGMITPVLFLPLTVLRWTDDQLMSVLLHELAHIKRKDHITWPLLNLAVSWLWFNPVLWVALAQMKRDRERACDDYAIARGSNIANYAQHLLAACVSLRPASRLAPITLLFARTHEVEQRITYMLNCRISRRPIGRAQQLAFALLPVLVAIPVISVTGFSTAVSLHEVTPQERDAVISTLEGFYSELSHGSDFEATKDNYLTSDYFDAPHLTLENLDAAVRRPPFDNTLSLIREAGVGVAKEVRCEITSLQRDGDEFVATQRLNIIADRIHGDIRYDAEDGTIVRIPNPGSAVEECHLVNALTQQVRLRQEDGVWKISQFDDGVAIMQMDTDNPYGPIFLVWMEDIDSLTTPSAALMRYGD
jgi:beta-lactamase regulating signal transducer with metallopeptidase domain